MIRDYEEKDASGLCAVNFVCYEHPEPDLDLLDTIKRGKAWVSAKPEHGVTGFIVGRIKHGLPYVHNIAVLPECRRLGIGKTLMEKFEGFFGERIRYKGFWLQVNADNPAQKLYFDLGYRVESVDENFYGTGKHGLCMFKYS